MAYGDIGKRQRIIETAYDLFRRFGFHATGIDRIIAEAGVAKMTMYRHFGGKDDVIVAVLAWRAARFSARLDRLVSDAGDAETGIAAIFDWYARWFRRRDFCGCLFAHALAEFADPKHPVFKAASAQKSDMIRRMQRLLRGVVPARQAKAMATTLLMLLEGATLLAQMGDGNSAIREARAAAMRMIAERAAA